VNRWFGPVVNMIKAAVLTLFVGQTLKAFTAKETTETLDEITELIEAGQLTPVIDRTYPLAEAAQAVKLVEQGSPAGKVTVTITIDRGPQTPITIQKQPD
jgi:NADPH:quinone reductase-like Zn-dependent oxidoreductase